MSAIKSFAASLLAIAGVIGGLDAQAVTSVFPAGWGGWIAALISACAAAFHILKGAGQTADATGAKTAVQKIAPLLLIATATAVSMAMTSCSSVPWVFSSPYGSVINTSNGTTYVPPEPVAVHSNK